MGRLDKSRLWLIIMSLILSIALRTYISGEESVDVEKDVYLHIIPPKGMAVIGNTERKLKVTLAAPRNILSLLGPQRININYKIKNTDKPGNYTFYLRERDIPLPQRGINVTEIYPKEIEVELDELISKRLNIKANIIGSPSEGYIIDKAGIFMDPSSVLVKGPKKELDKMKYILTKEIDIIGRTRAFRMRTELLASNFIIEGKNLVDVFIPIRNAGYRKTYKNIAVYILGDPMKDYSITVKPSIVDLELKGAKHIIDSLSKKDIKAYIDITELSSGEYKLPLMLNSNFNISIAGNVPIISVQIEDKIKALPVSANVNEEAKT